MLKIWSLYTEYIEAVFQKRTNYEYLRVNTGVSVQNLKTKRLNTCIFYFVLSVTNSNQLYMECNKTRLFQNF